VAVSTVIEQIAGDFAADRVRVEGFYLYVGDRYRSFINIDTSEIRFCRSSSNRGQNYLLFLATYLYDRFQLIPARGTLSHDLLVAVELARVRRFHRRMHRFGHGVGYIEYWDGEQWRIKAVPYSDPDFRVKVALPSPSEDARSTGDEEDLEELQVVPEAVTRESPRLPYPSRALEYHGKNTYLYEMTHRMDAERFEAGYDPGTYVHGLRNYRSFVRDLMDTARADISHVQSLVAATEHAPRPVRATILTEDWCGDSAVNTPILASLFHDAGIPLRIFRGSEAPDLKQLYAEDGITHIPVVSLWDGEGRELTRWVEAPRAVQIRKDEWKQAHPEFVRLQGTWENDREAARRFAVLYREFLQEMARWYREGMWSETTREIVESLG
jgi:hypothetical protein